MSKQWQKVSFSRTQLVSLNYCYNKFDDIFEVNNGLSSLFRSNRGLEMSLFITWQELVRLNMKTNLSLLLMKFRIEILYLFLISRFTWTDLTSRFWKNLSRALHHFWRHNTNLKFMRRVYRIDDVRSRSNLWLTNFFFSGSRVFATSSHFKVWRLSNSDGNCEAGWGARQSHSRYAIYRKVQLLQESIFNRFLTLHVHCMIFRVKVTDDFHKKGIENRCVFLFLKFHWT